MRIPRPKELRALGAEASRQLLERPLYTLGIRIYRLGIVAASMRNPKARRMVEGRKDTWKELKCKVNPDDCNIWVHAASAGEFEQGRPLMEEIKRRHPDKKIILTIFSPSGYDVANGWKGADCVALLPFDTPRNARKLIRLINPEKVFFVKYEIWRNLLQELDRRGIPTYLVSAVFTPEQRFFRKSTKWYSLWLKWFTRIFVQDEGSRKLMAGIGIDNAVVAGDTRFDRVDEIMLSAREIPALKVLHEEGNVPVVAVGSSWEEDENIIFPWLKKNRNKVRAIIAPHEFDDRRIDAMRRNLNPLRVVLLSEISDDVSKTSDADCVILNCYGLLSSAYRYADFAYVGGGFGAGIHNINEAAVYGIPVTYGPKNSRFPEAAEMARCGGGFPIKDASDTQRILTGLCGDPSLRQKAGEKAGAYIRSHLGATSRILSTLDL